MYPQCLRILMVATSYPPSTRIWMGGFIYEMSAALSRCPAVDLRLWAPPGDLPAGVASALVGDDSRQLRLLLERGSIAYLLALARYFGDLAEVRAIPFGVARHWFELSRQYIESPPVRWLVVTRLTRAKLGDLLAWGEGHFRERRELHLCGPCFIARRAGGGHGAD